MNTQRIWDLHMSQIGLTVGMAAVQTQKFPKEEERNKIAPLLKRFEDNEEELKKLLGIKTAETASPTS